MFDLHNQTAIVTGGAAGIGRGIVESLREAGATVIIADLDLAAAERTAAETGSHARELDVTDRDQVRAVFASVAEEFGGIQILCSNAGVFPQATLDELTDEKWEQMFNINTRGTFVVVQEVLPYMRRERYGRIVITTSITGSHTGYPGWSHYGASKAAQQGFMRGAALEVARDGIRINSVRPGMVDTPIHAKTGQADRVAKFAAQNPLGRAGLPEEVAEAIVWLLSEKSSLVTGAALDVMGAQR